MTEVSQIGENAFKHSDRRLISFGAVIKVFSDKWINVACWYLVKLFIENIVH